jgi:hypothetical protein
MVRTPLLSLCLVLLPGCSSVGDASEDTVKGDKTSLVSAIDAKRKAIEGRLDGMTRKTLPTTGLREQIKQKWSKVDFYVDAGQVARIKTYPHPQVSTRTEEFYFDGGQLIYAYIEDKGLDDRERGGTHNKGKAYYYWQGKFVTEKNWSGEPERSIRQSDEERLEQEALEYLELYKQQVR